MTINVALALQGGGSHGAFTWGVLHRLLDEVRLQRMTISAISGSSAGAINGALCASELALGPVQHETARQAQSVLNQFWNRLSERAYFHGNALLGGTSPGCLDGFNLDWSPLAIWLEIASLIVSPYDTPLYTNPLAPLLDELLPPAALARINRGGIALHVCATNVATNRRRIFSSGDISIATLLASACLPCNFKAIDIEGKAYWDGAFLGNPALAPLVKSCDDILVVTVNPLQGGSAPPRSARQILDRLNDINGNAPLVLEMNAIHAINKLLGKLSAPQGEQTGFRPIHLHLIRNERLMAPLGFVSKGNASPAFLRTLFDGGCEAAEQWLNNYRARGTPSSCSWETNFDIEHDLLDPVLKCG
jgi:NTE family protein